MTHADFVKAIETLKSTYSEKAYPDARVKRIWFWARGLNAKTFAEAIDDAVADCAQAPLLAKLKEHYAICAAKNPAREKVACDYCDGNGYITDDKPLPTAFACKCEAGNAVPVFVARWNGAFKRIVPTKAELEWTEAQKVVRSAIKAF